MNLFQLVLKQMRQRALSTWLTLLSVILGAALAISVLILRRESAAIFAQADYGYDLLVGAKGSPMQLVLNTIYHIDKSPGNIPYITYEFLVNNRSMVKYAIPYAVGDQFKGHRVAGTVPEFFGFDPEGHPLTGYDDKGRVLPGYQSPADYDESSGKKPAAETFNIRFNKRFTLAQGRMFHPRKFQAVLGSDVTSQTGLKLGDRFKVRHDEGKGERDDEHDETWEVVGILDKTYTAEDRVLFIPLISFYAIPKHEKAMDIQSAIQKGEDLSRFSTNQKPTTKPATQPAKHDHDDDDHDRAPAAQTKPSTAPAKHDHDHDHDDRAKPATTQAHAGHEGHDHDEPYVLNADGTIDLKLPKNRWQLSAVLVRTRSAYANSSLTYLFSNSPMAAAVNPAGVMREFFNTFLAPTTLILLVISMLVVATAAVSILVSIYNAVSARSREIAIMRALGATRGRILTLICVEAGIIGLVGGVLGLLIGHGIGAIESVFFAQKLGVGINYLVVDRSEWLYLIGIVALSILAGLVPGLKAYRTPVATNLVGS